MQIIDKVDEFRFINNLNTQVRSLAICSQIVKKIGERHISMNILRQNLIEWSRNLEDTSQEYREHNGKLTQDKKPTSAFEKYLEFSHNFGLCTALNEIIIITPLGQILCTFVSDKVENKFFLTNEEKLFFLCQLFRKDADALILALDLIFSLQNGASQSQLMLQFETTFKNRLLTKQNYSIGTVQAELGDKFRVVEFQWKNAQSYSEHIIIPRIEWLADLGIVKIHKTQQRTSYECTTHGKELYDSLLSLPNSQQKDVNDNWLNKKSMTVFCKMLHSFGQMRKWPSIPTEEKIPLLKPHIEKAYSIFSKGGAMRMPLYPVILFICVKLACKDKVITEFSELEHDFRNNLLINNKQYSLRTSARANESYISVNLN